MLAPYKIVKRYVSLGPKEPPTTSITTTTTTTIATKFQVKRQKGDLNVCILLAVCMEFPLGHVADTRTEQKIVDIDRKTIHYKLKHAIIHEGWKTPTP